MSSLGARQLAQIATQRDRDLDKRAKGKLVELRSKLRGARAQRRESLKRVRCDCKAARERNRARAKKARERLSASIRRTREHAREICTLATGEAQRSTLHGISSAVDALHGERATQKQLAAWTKPKRKEQRSSRAERRQESDDEVLSNIDEPGLRVVWAQVKHKIKAGPRRSRTEAFYEWVGENSADVYAIQDADADRYIEDLERLEKKLAKAKGKKLRDALEAVPF